MTTLEEDERFGPPLNENDIEELNNSILSKNTSKRNNWAIHMFCNWLSIRHPGENLEIKNFSVVEINDFLSRFIHEVRRNDGERYPNTTLVSIVAGLNSFVNHDGGTSLFRDEKSGCINEAVNT